MNKSLTFSAVIHFVWLGAAGSALPAQDATTTSRSPEPDRSARVDPYGDPLPEGALLRLGTVRLRHHSFLTCIAFSPDGRTIASAATNLDHGVYLWETATGKIIRHLQDPDAKLRSIEAFSFSPDGTKLACGSGSMGEQVFLWDLKTGQLVFKAKGHASGVTAVAFSPDGARFASGGTDGLVRVWDVASRSASRDFDTGDRPHRATLAPGAPAVAYEGTPGVTAVAFSPDGRLLAAGTGNQNTIHLWKLQTGQAAARIEDAHGNGVRSLAFLPDGKQLVSGGSRPGSHPEWKTEVAAPEVRFWDASTGKMLRELRPAEPEGGNGAMALSADGKTIASGAYGRIRLWDAATGKSPSTVPQPGFYGGKPLAISPDGKTVAAAAGNTIALWDAASTKPILQDFKGHRSEAVHVEYSPDGAFIASGGSDGRVMVWEAASGRPLYERSLGPESSVTAMTLSRDGQVLAAGGRMGPGKLGTSTWMRGVHIWRAKSGENLRDIEISDLFFHLQPERLALSPDGKLLAVAGMAAHEGIEVWDIGSGKKAAELRPEKGSGKVHEMAFTADSKAVYAVECYPAATRIWDVAGAKLERTFVPHLLAKSGDKPDPRLTISGAVLSADAKRLITCQDRSIVVWDVAGGKPLSTAQMRDDSKCRYLGLSRDGRLLATADSPYIKQFGADGMMIYAIDPASGHIRVWEPESLRPLGALESNDGFALSLAFSPDNRRLVTGMDRGTVLVWEFGTSGQ
jgi:WD40 repeat protein